MEENNGQKIDELIGKLRKENKAFKKDANTARRDLESAAKHVAGALLATAWKDALNENGSLFERSFLACDMAMIVATAQLIACENPTFTDNERKVAERTARELFRRAARLQKAILPFAEIHSDYFNSGNLLDASQTADYLIQIKDVWALLSEAENLYDSCVEWRHAWTQGMNELIAAE